MLVLNNINARVGMYLRISLEDGDKLESNSIDNQRKIIYEYLKKNNFNVIKEFIDDGATGTNFERKGFKELLQSIENKEVNTVITKDVSRIGRNYVKTGYYIEDYFLNRGVRYISILDEIDTYNDLIGNELLPFRAILNDMYSKDISLKQKSSLIERKKRGRYIACYAPYGYKKNEKVVGKLDVDEVASKVVKRIFELFLSGQGTVNIAKILTKEKIPTPAMHLNMNADKESKLYSVWKSASVKRILRNETYLGYMIQNKEKTISHKNPTRVYLKQEEYIKIPNHHIAIISNEDFQKANKILDEKKKKYSYSRKEKNLLNDFLFCKECGKRLYRTEKKNGEYYHCATRTQYHLCDNNNYIPYKKIENKVLEYLKKYIHQYSNKELLVENYKKEYKKYKTNIDGFNVEIANLSKELNKINGKIDTIYNDKLNNIIPIEMYKKFSASYKEKRVNIDNKIKKINKLIDDEKKKIKDLNNEEKKINNLVEKFCNLQSINKDVLDEFLDKIYIDKNKNFYINLKFKI